VGFIVLRKISAVLLGLVAAIATVMLIQWIGHQVYPPPPNLDFNDPVQLRAFMKHLPLGAFLFVLLSYGLGTLLGGLTACRVAGQYPVVFASIVGAVILAATIANLAMIPHPTWFSIAGIVVIGAGTLLAIRWSAPTRRVSRSFEGNSQ
jgi:pimeloyl-ACP methyl ester carboxylesterase